MSIIINNPYIFTHIVKHDEKLYDYLKNELVLSMRQTNSFIKNRRMFLNDQIITKNKTILAGDCLRLEFSEEENNYVKEAIPLDIVYESDDLLIINKQPGMVVHETKGHSHQTIANGISYYFNQIGLKRKIRFVNRLDMDTSGLLIVAKNSYAHQFLAKQFDDDKIEKLYLAIIKGKLPTRELVVDKPIEKDGERYITSSEGKSSETFFQVIKEYHNVSLIECKLKTGRTHQIRVHLHSLGTPILGDVLYDGSSDLIDRQALHAYKLSFIEPRTHKLIRVEVPLPQDMSQIME